MSINIQEPVEVLQQMQTGEINDLSVDGVRRMSRCFEYTLDSFVFVNLNLNGLSMQAFVDKLVLMDFEIKGLTAWLAGIEDKIDDGVWSFVGGHSFLAQGVAHTLLCFGR